MSRKIASLAKLNASASGQPLASLSYKSNGTAVAINSIHSTPVRSKAKLIHSQGRQQMERNLLITLVLVGLTLQATQTLAKPKGKSSKLRKYKRFVWSFSSDSSHLQLPFSRFVIVTLRI